MVFDANKQLNEFASDYLKLAGESHAYTQKYGYSNINISTMTLVSKTNMDDINMEMIVNEFDNNITFDATLKKKQRDDVPLVTKRGKVKRNFFNQATLSFKDTTTKSIKIFTNGKMQMTGVTSMLEGVRVFTKVCHLLSKCLSTDVYCETIKIAMINSDFCIRRRVNLRKLEYYICKENKIQSVSYDPDTYPGLKIKYKGVSIFVFGTGSVVITGSDAIDRLHDAFKFIVTTVESYDDVTWDVTHEKKKTRVYENGYPKNVIECCALKYFE